MVKSFRRAGVHAASAGRRIDFVEFVLDQQVFLARIEPVEVSQKLLVARAARFGIFGVGDLALAKPGGQRLLFFAQLGLYAVQLQIELQILFDVLGPDRLGAFEHHVLEQVRDAGDAGMLIHRADLGDPSGRYSASLCAAPAESSSRCPGGPPAPARVAPKAGRKRNK